MMEPGTRIHVAIDGVVISALEEVASLDAAASTPALYYIEGDDGRRRWVPADQVTRAEQIERDHG